MRNRKSVVLVTLALATGGAFPLGNRQAAAQTPMTPVQGPAPSSPPPPPPLVLPYPDGHAGHHHYGLFGDARYRSPGLAVVLSLTPIPVDFGNLYAENFGWGVAYSALEVSMMVPMMWFVGGHVNHGWDEDRRWSSGETNTMVALVGGYVAVKLVAGLHAGYAARGFNRRTGTGGRSLRGRSPGSWRRRRNVGSQPLRRSGGGRGGGAAKGEGPLASPQHTQPRKPCAPRARSAQVLRDKTAGRQQPEV